MIELELHDFDFIFPALHFWFGLITRQQLSCFVSMHLVHPIQTLAQISGLR